MAARLVYLLMDVDPLSRRGYDSAHLLLFGVLHPFYFFHRVCTPVTHTICDEALSLKISNFVVSFNIIFLSKARAACWNTQVGRYISGCLASYPVHVGMGHVARLFCGWLI